MPRSPGGGWKGDPRAHRALVISITRGGSVAGDRCNLVILIASGEGKEEGEPYPSYFYNDCWARGLVIFVAGSQHNLVI